MANKKSIKAELRAKKFAKNFVENGGNATQAYSDLGSNTAPGTNEVGGTRMLRKDSVQKEIASFAAQAGFDAVTVLTRIRQRAMFDFRKLYRPDGTLKPIHEIDDDTAAGLKEIKVTEVFAGEGDEKHVMGLVKEVKAIDAGQDLERLGRHLKLFTDKVEHSGEVQLVYDYEKLLEE